MENQNGYPDSPMEGDDAAYPCKGCGQVLEEGKAFELAGHRWHIDCFRCNTCGTLLDSDANLLLLGDGSLICNNCTYSCSACGNKIEDLAILTGDQAYCAGCFRCRNCKKKIENLRYARTSQGMFCMDCHDALMARRRKKTSRGSHRSKSGHNNAMLLDKSLPSLPPNAVSQSAFSPDQETLSDSYSESTPIELPGSTPTGKGEGLTLPPSQYRQRNSGISQRSELEDTDNGFFIPMTLDPNPAPGPSPLRQQKFELDGSASNVRRSDGNSDYFALLSGQSSRKGSYAQGQSGDDSRPHSPHTAAQEQGWDGNQDAAATSRRRGNSSALDKRASHSAQPSRAQPEQNKFQLQEAPKRKKSIGSKRNSRGEPVMSPELIAESKGRNGSLAGHAPLREQQINVATNEQSPRASSLGVPNAISPRVSSDSRGDENASLETAKTASNELGVLPKRGDSLQKSLSSSNAIPRKEVRARTASSNLAQEPAPESSPQSSSAAQRSLDGANKGAIRSTELPAPRSSLEYPPRSKDRPSGALPISDAFNSPQAVARLSPEAPSKHQANSSISSLRSATYKGDPGSPGMSRYSRNGDEEEHGKLDIDGHDQSFLRRVSKSVRHARSHSDRGNRSSKDGKWTKGSVNGAGETLVEDSPSPAGGDSRDDLGWLRAELQKERERNADATKTKAELAAVKNELVEQRQRASKLSEKNFELENVLDGKTTIKQVNSELREKRSTMVVLDTQKEIVVRELEILTDHIAASKSSKEPLDFSNLSQTIMREFASKLQKLKDSYTPRIEELTEKRFELQTEVAKLSVSREKAQEEFRHLSAKNTQLMELNHSLINQVQDLHKSGATIEGLSSKHHGLGIYTHHQKDNSSLSVDSREVRPSLADSHYSGSTLAHEQDAEGAMILNAPRVVNIRKEQPKKTFNWKKGGTVAKGVTKGLKGAFSSSDSRTPREASITEGTPYGAMSQNGEPPSMMLPGGRGMQQEPYRQGFGGFFGQQKMKPQPGRSLANGNMISEEPMHPSKLFGVELELRAEHERVNIPSIVTRCIQEVELRGMDQEGIYRKSGGAAQIQVIRDGFVQSNDYDISDPDLDINAVTSCLKQYFRKLPTPLITFTVYDLLLDSVGTPANEERIQFMRAAVKELPPHHRDCLEFLVFHLARVIEREKENLMTAMNCAVVFAPTIMRPESITREMTDTAAKNTAVQFLIEHCHAVFLGENGSV